MTAPARETIAGRYQLLREIGRGGQARTYLAYDLRTGELVAVKRLLLAHADDWKAVELFEREGRVLSRLSHPNIPRYIEAIGESDHQDEDHGFVLVQQYVEGESLAAQLARGELMDEARAVAFMQSVLPVLGYLHGQHPPVIHRDLKPSNIIRRLDGTYALIDFGAIQAVLPAAARSGSTIVGTTGYMAPEQFMGRATPATDLYALGATVLHLLTGVHPADLPVERMALQYGPVLPRVSPRFRAVLDRLLAPAAEDRFQSAAELEAALAEEPPARAPGPDERAREASARVAKRVIIAMVLFVAGSLGYLYAEEQGAFDGPPPFSASTSGAQSAKGAAVPSSDAVQTALRGPRPIPVTFDLGRDGAGLELTDRGSVLSTYNDSSSLHLKGHLRSNRDDLIDEVKGRVELLDAAGAVLKAQPVVLVSKYRPELRKGDALLFGSHMMAPLGVDQARLVITSTLVRAAGETPPQSTPFEPAWEVPRDPAREVSIRLRTEDKRALEFVKRWILEYAFEVEHRGAAPIRTLKMALRVRDRDGKLLKVAESYAVIAASTGELLPGDTVLFGLLAQVDAEPGEIEIAVIALD